MKNIECDFLVAGGGIAGMCAAVAAARKGLKVVLINDRSVLGGNASSEIGVPISGACHQGLNPSIYSKECGLVEEIRMELARYQSMEGYGSFAMIDAVFFDFIYSEKNIYLMLNTLVEDCTVDNGIITGCIARHEVNNEIFSIKAKYFVDATGNGTLAYSAGAEYRIGREGKNEYGEYWAPEKADSYTMGNSILFETEDMGREVKFEPPAFAHDITKMEFLKDINKPENFRGFSVNGPNWTYEFGGQIDILNEHNETERELRCLIYGIWDYVKNSGKYPEAKNKRLKRVFAKAGTRESRRFMGDYVLTENDIENKVNFIDSVAVGGWPMDIHAPLGIYDKLPASNFVPVTGNYNIPFRSLYSKNIQNLMLAGRNISATHIALGSTRVMATCGALGQAVGTAAYLCVKYGETPRQLAKKHIKKLQSLLLADDQTILHLKDSISKGFTATATSEKAFENIKKDEFMRAERDYALCLMCTTDKIDSIEIYAKGKGKLNFKVFTGVHKETFIPEKLVNNGSVEIKKEGWVTVPVNSSVGEDKKLYIVFEENNNIEFGVSKDKVMGAVSCRMHRIDSHDGRNHDSLPLNEKSTGYTHMDHIYEDSRNILFKNIVPTQSAFGAENAVNGYARPYGRQNIWLPSSLPATIVIQSEKPVNTKNISVIFDTQLDVDEKAKGIRKTLAKAYELKVYGENGTQVFVCDDNYMRVARHKINQDKINKIEITIRESYGENAGIYGIRL
ncbi:MAG: FAD-dependent oxidoreductase [Ruminococcaceae bacterium]|nr:FAD-dependent oxidoreductase [Oscillospiraceae bacterium]